MAKSVKATPKREQALLQHIEKLQSKLDHATNISELVSVENKDMLETIQDLRKYCEELQEDLANQKARAKVSDARSASYLEQLERESFVKEQIHTILDLRDVPRFKQVNQDMDTHKLTLLQRITLLTTK